MDGSAFVALLLFLSLAGLLVAAPLLAWIRLAGLRRELRELSARVHELERRAAAAARDQPVPADFAAAPGTAAAASLQQTPTPPAPAPATSGAAAPIAAGTLPADAAARFAGPDRAHVPASSSAGPPGRAGELEDRIGGVWMQNLGAVVLLLGVFLFIIWGYGTGRLGAGALVATGVGLGLAAAVWGERLSRSLPRLGYAFIGAGIGAIYLSLFLGHFTLHLLPRVLALALLLLTSLGAFATGLRHRVQAIAAFGVLGAFIPQLFASWFSLRGFALDPLALLGYFAVVDVLVFALAARAGWSRLDLWALLLTTLTWLVSVPRTEVGLAPILGLALLFTGLGLAPLPVLVREEGRVRAVDLAVVALAPAGLILTTWPWILSAPRTSSAIFLFALAALQLTAAAWVDSRRPERDLWRPLTGAAVVFATLGVQRVVDESFLALTWGTEGVLLLWLGLSQRSGWLRFWGQAVTALATLVALGSPERRELAEPPMPFAVAGAWTELAMVALLLLAAVVLARARDRLSPSERWAPEAWTLAGNLLLLPWTWARGDELTRWVHDVSGPPSLGLGDAAARLRWPGLFSALLGAAWFLHAAVLAWLGARPGRAFLRGCAYAMAGLAMLATLISFGLPDHWRRGAWPVLYPEGIAVVAGMLAALALTLRLARRRDALGAAEFRAPEVLGVGIIVILLAWSAREALHVAEALSRAGTEPGSTRTLAAALTSAAWLLEAMVLLALGWVRSTTLLRWAGLAILGLTLGKFMIHDLASADVFWRFLTAIAAGAAMLAVSYAYQRRVRDRGAPR